MVNHTCHLVLKVERMGTHGEPEEGMECMVTFNDITKENFCEYQTVPSGKWHPCKFCAEVVRDILLANSSVFATRPPGWFYALSCLVDETHLMCLP